ncbi:putative membrane protein [Herbihabitans rhizosphaerae]|uniref:Putative membrane protein n=1 Tax=Herbihabitans rhizosphaerae TaxID=1872711 RepID=A0A4Q7KR40_9PSEU|nr:hypothetical protein [Herbihabitans rhizosphaerae]RZS39309.1 putative membrane protein [Herbihabitans rhizosphaerae]
MNSSTVDTVESYVDALKKALSDLPSSEVEEILDDVRPQLVDVAAELPTIEAMTERLGTPEKYAAELRAAAGYPNTAATASADWSARLAVLGLLIGVGSVLLGGIYLGLVWFRMFTRISPLGEAERTMVLAVIAAGLTVLAITVVFVRGNGRMARIAALPGLRRATSALDDADHPIGGYLRSLQPGWWLVRALAMVAVVSLPVSTFGSPVAWACTIVLVGLLALPGSVYFGKRAARNRRSPWLAITANALIVGILLTGVFVVFKQASQGPAVVYSARGLTHDGVDTHNLYAFDGSGRPIPDFYLYDQNGKPINARHEVCGPWGMPKVEERTDNRFPRNKVTFDSRVARSCREIPGVPFSVALPNSSPPR